MIMARYTRIINCRPCCNLYLLCSQISWKQVDSRK